MTKPKSLEELAKEVLDTQEGISPQDFDVLINPGGPNVMNPPPVSQPIVEPTPAPAAPAPTAPAPVPSTESLVGEPNILELVPEKFRDKDVQSSIGKMAKHYQDLEAELKKQQDEVANMQKIMQSLATTPAPVPQVQALRPQEPEIKDADFFEKPLETVKRLVDQRTSERLQQYHADQERSKFVNDFRTARPDFDLVRQEIMDVLAARPDLDRDPRNLPIVYEMAKQLKVKKISDLKASLGLEQPVIQPTPVLQPAAQPLDREQLKAELVAEIIAEANRRKKLQGLQGGTPPITPQARVAQISSPTPATPEDQIFSDMMTSGPKKLSIELDQ